MSILAKHVTDNILKWVGHSLQGKTRFYWSQKVSQTVLNHISSHMGNNCKNCNNSNFLSYGLTSVTGLWCITANSANKIPWSGCSRSQNGRIISGHGNKMSDNGSKVWPVSNDTPSRWQQLQRQPHLSHLQNCCYHRSTQQVQRTLMATYIWIQIWTYWSWIFL